MRIEFAQLTTAKNLLAFSGGVDSTALFFLLLEQNIPFDIAIVNYNTRAESIKEVEYAQNLAEKYHKKCFVQSVKLQKNNFEKKARDVRYAFFEQIIKDENYQTLITAHQLNDKLEWFLMQLSRGAGLQELLGLHEFIEKKNYTIYRPLLNIAKSSLEEYVNSNKIKYFYDSSNSDLKYRRNYFREKYCNAFLKDYEKGVQNSFSFLQKDLDSLSIQHKPIFTQKELEIFAKNSDDNINIRVIDSSLKKRGYLLSLAQRNEILRQRDCVIDKYAICLDKNYIFIALYSKSTTMTKEFKEKCRVLKIPAKIRGYLFENQIDLLLLKTYDKITKQNLV